jgi:hypothetical protein
MAAMVVAVVAMVVAMVAAAGTGASAVIIGAHLYVITQLPLALSSGRPRLPPSRRGVAAGGKVFVTIF